MNALLEVHHALGRLDGAAAIAIGGEVVETWARGDADGARMLTPETRLPIGSITKSITAAAVLELVAAGRFDLHAPIAHYLPTGLVGWGDRVTLHHCLAHTSGIPSLFKAHWGVPSVTTEQVTSPIDRVTLVRQFGGLPLRFEPGTRFEYSNSGYVLLAIAIEHATGGSFHDHLARTVLAGTQIGPLVPDAREAVPMIGGIAAPVIHPSWQVGAGDLAASVGELARWQARVRTPQLFEPHTPHYGYGYRVGVRDTRRVVWHEGVLPGVVATTHRALDHDVVVVVITHRIPPQVAFARTFVNRVADQLVAAGCGAPPPDPPEPPRPFTDVELAELPGRYRVDHERVLVVERDSDGLTARAEGPWLLQGSDGPTERDEEQVAEVARRLIAAVREDRWDEAFALGSSVLRQLETPASLARVWSSAIAELGRLDDARLILVGAGVACWRARFASGATLDLRVTTDEDGRSVSGLYVVEPDLLPAITRLPLRATSETLYCDGFRAGVSDTWVQLDPATHAAIVRRKYC